MKEHLQLKVKSIMYSANYLGRELERLLSSPGGNSPRGNRGEETILDECGEQLEKVMQEIEKLYYSSEKKRKESVCKGR